MSLRWGSNSSHKGFEQEGGFDGRDTKKLTWWYHKGGLLEWHSEELGEMKAQGRRKEISEMVGPWYHDTFPRRAKEQIFFDLMPL